MLPKHPDCSACCAQGRCHFCLRPARHVFDDGAQSYECCGAHLLYLGQDPLAPGAVPELRGRVLALPLDEMASAVIAQDGGGARMVGRLGRETLGSLEPPTILRG